MPDLRFDVAPLPIVELAPIRLAAAGPAEPFVLRAGDSRRTGDCRLQLRGLRHADGGADFVAAAGADVRATITPCGVVRTAVIDGVLLTERVAVLAGPATSVLQWSVDTAADLALEGGDVLRVGAGQTATGIRGADPAGDIAQAFRATVGALTRALRAGVQLETSDGTGAALAWAKARLWNRGTPALFPTSLAALASGWADEVRARLNGPAGDDPTAVPLVAARYASWTGDLQGVGDVRRRLPQPNRLRRTWSEEEFAAAVWLAGVAELARTATDVGESAFAAELHGIVKRARAALAARPLSPTTASMLCALRAPLPQPASSRRAPPVSDDVAAHAWHTWGALEQGLLRHGRAGWHRLVAEAETPVRGAWPARFGATDDDPVAAALFVLALVHGLLGIESDAPRHRIRIAPRPAAAHRLDARAIPCGDASVSLAIRAEDGSLTLRLAQDAGAIPLTAWLEPVIDGPIAATFVDGRRAELNVRPHGLGVAVPLQLVLDAERTLRIERDQPWPRA